MYVYAEPKSRLRDYTVTALLDKKTYKDGLFSLNAELAGAPSAGEIAVTVYDGDKAVLNTAGRVQGDKLALDGVCLLYTSDAADE